MTWSFETTRRVEFADTDMAGIVHFSNFFRFMESTEHEFFRSLGLSVHGEEEGRMFGFARVAASAEFLRPARYEDLLLIRLEVREKSTRFLRYGFEIERREPAAQQGENPLLARGELTVVHVTRPEGETRMRATALPEAVDRLVETAPETTSPDTTP